MRTSVEVAKRTPAAVHAGGPDRPPGRYHNLPGATLLPLAVPGIAIAGYVGILAAFWVSFASDASAALSIGVSTVYGLVFFGVPYFMMRTAARHGPSSDRPSLSEFLNGGFETNTGRISGWSALVQVALVPVALAFGTMAIGFIYVWTV